MQLSDIELQLGDSLTIVEVFLVLTDVTCIVALIVYVDIKDGVELPEFLLYLLFRPQLIVEGVSWRETLVFWNTGIDLFLTAVNVRVRSCNCAEGTYQETGQMSLHFWRRQHFCY